MIIHWRGILVELGERWFAERCRTSWHAFLAWKSSVGCRVDSVIGCGPASGPAGSRTELETPPCFHLPYAAQVFQIEPLFASFPRWLTQLAWVEEEMGKAQNDTFLSLEPMRSSHETNGGQMRINASKTTRAESTKTPLLKHPFRRGHMRCFFSPVPLWIIDLRSRHNAENKSEWMPTGAHNDTQTRSPLTVLLSHVG